MKLQRRKSRTKSKYRRVLKSENNGFDSPNQDDCGEYSKWQNHMRDNAHESIQNYDECALYEIRKNQYVKARIEYKKDVTCRGLGSNIGITYGVEP